MGWSEQYWEDVKSEMEQLGRERRSAQQDKASLDTPGAAAEDEAPAPEPVEAS